MSETPMVASPKIDDEAPASADGPAAACAEDQIANVVQRLLAEHSIERTFYFNDDLRDVGLTSLDMASLVLAVEAQFDIFIPERHITPANFRSVAAITALVASLRSMRLTAAPA